MRHNVKFQGFHLAILALGVLLSMSGCVWFEGAVADKDHFSKDDRVLGKWTADEGVPFEIREGKAGGGIYELVDEDGEVTPFRLLNIDGLLIVTLSEMDREKGEVVNLDAVKRTHSALCQIGTDGKLRLFDLNEQAAGKAIERKQLKGTIQRRPFGSYSSVTVTSAKEARAWIKTNGRTVFEREPDLTFTRR